jgi:transcriptional regulator with XRE-family HTH domain
MFSSVAQTMVIAERLKLAFERTGISQSEWASRIGVSNSLISQWLSGKKCPSVDVLERAIAALGCSMDEFYRLRRGQPRGEAA